MNSCCRLPPPVRKLEMRIRALLVEKTLAFFATAVYVQENLVLNTMHRF